jgi:hypothetical protein
VEQNTMQARFTLLAHGEANIPGQINVRSSAFLSGSITILPAIQMQARFTIEQPPRYTVSSQAQQDAFVNRNNPYMNYGQEGEMLVQDSRQIAFLAFSALAVPEYGDVLAADLLLYKLSEQPCTLKIYRLNQAFNENSLTWLNRPVAGALIATVTLEQGIRLCRIDLLAYLKAA